MKERIRQLMEQLNLNQQEFSKKIRVSSASISNILAGRSNPTHNHVMAIHAALPEVNVNWLMFGEGEMFGTGAVVREAGSQPEVANATDTQPNLFDQPQQPTVQAAPVITDHEVQRGKAKKIDKQQRRVKEIIVYYDDGTYETLKAAR